MVRHGKEMQVDLTLLATPDAIHGCPHVVVDAPFRHAAEHAEAVPVGIEEHLVGLKQISPHEECPAVRQLDMGYLQLGALAVQNCIILAPVELEGFTRPEGQRHEGAAPRGLLIALAIRAPSAGESSDPVVGTGELKGDKICVQMRERTACVTSTSRS